MAYYGQYQQNYPSWGGSQMGGYGGGYGPSMGGYDPRGQRAAYGNRLGGASRSMNQPQTGGYGGGGFQGGYPSMGGYNQGYGGGYQGGYGRGPGMPGGGMGSYYMNQYQNQGPMSTMDYQSSRDRMGLRPGDPYGGGFSGGYPSMGGYGGYGMQPPMRGRGGYQQMQQRPQMDYDRLYQDYRGGGMDTGGFLGHLLGNQELGNDLHRRLTDKYGDYSTMLKGQQAYTDQGVPIDENAEEWQGIPMPGAEIGV